jgi:hypothetical protein
MPAPALFRHSAMKACLVEVMTRPCLCSRTKCSGELVCGLRASGPAMLALLISDGPNWYTAPGRGHGVLVYPPLDVLRQYAALGSRRGPARGVQRLYAAPTTSPVLGYSLVTSDRRGRVLRLYAALPPLLA